MAYHCVDRKPLSRSPRTEPSMRKRWTIRSWNPPSANSPPAMSSSARSTKVPLISLPSALMTCAARPPEKNGVIADRSDSSVTRIPFDAQSAQDTNGRPRIVGSENRAEVLAGARPSDRSPLAHPHAVAVPAAADDEPDEMAVTFG